MLIATTKVGPRRRIVDPLEHVAATRGTARRPLHTLTVGPYTVTSTLTAADLEELLPSAADRLEWARRAAGQPRRTEPQPVRPPAPVVERAELLRWTDRALCREDSPDEEAGLVDWVPESGTGGPGNLDTARAVCARCPVLSECRTTALGGFPIYGTQVWGIWAGTTQAEREALERAERRAVRRAS